MARRYNKLSKEARSLLDFEAKESLSDDDTPTDVINEVLEVSCSLKLYCCFGNGTKPQVNHDSVSNLRVASEKRRILGGLKPAKFIDHFLRSSIRHFLAYISACA